MDMETEEKAVVEIPIQDTMDFKTKVIYNKDKKKVLSNCTSGYLSEDTPNTKSEIHMHPYINCSTIYNNQDMEAT